MLRRWAWSSMTTKRRKQRPEARRARIGFSRVNTRSRVKAMSSSSENWRTASMRLPFVLTAPSAAKADFPCGSLDAALKRCSSTQPAELRSAGQPRSTPPRPSRGRSGQAWAAVPTSSERTRAFAAPGSSIISSAIAKIPGLLGTTSRLRGESQRNQRDHCSRRGSTGRSRPWRTNDSVTRRLMASTVGLQTSVVSTRYSVLS